MTGPPVPPGGRLMYSPRFILIGGALLAFGAAFANMGIFIEAGTSVSHLTGDISRLSMDAVRSTPEVLTDILRVAGATLAFLTGAFIGGMLIHHPTLDLERPYGRTIIGIGLMFVVSGVVLRNHPVPAITLSALGCGLQNSLATRYRGIVLRTTHLTGLITDLGVTLGMRARGYDIPFWKIAVPAWLIGSFFLGGVSASFLALKGGPDPLLIAGIAYIVAGISWTLFKHLAHPGFVYGPDDGESD